MIWPFGSLQMFKYGVIVADPPWTFELRSERGNAKSASAQYDTMSDDEIAALPVGQLATRDCLLLMWTTGWAMATGRAQAIVRAWGAEPVSEIVWLKSTKNDKRRTGTGYRVRTRHEPILLAKYGNPRHDPFPSDFVGVAGAHSLKPKEFYTMVALHTLGAWRCDLFSAGVQRPGFEGWGDDHRNKGGEACHTTELSTDPAQTANGSGQLFGWTASPSEPAK